MKRYFTVLALLGILGFAGVSFAGATEDKAAKEAAKELCGNDATGQALVVGQPYTVGNKRFVAKEQDGKIVLIEQ